MTPRALASVTPAGVDVAMVSVNSMTETELFQMACLFQRKWGLLLSFNPDNLDEVYKAAPYLKPKKGRTTPASVFDGECYFFFDTQTEMMHFYDQTVGDDGPTRLNPYNGPARVYALTCDPEGKLRTENT